MFSWSCDEHPLLNDLIVIKEKESFKQYEIHWVKLLKSNSQKDLDDYEARYRKEYLKYERWLHEFHGNYCLSLGRRRHNGSEIFR